ncbi:MAG: hypothetical protein HOK65_14125 [Crocinitomicaceae bacterium]|nr:hypothetical protein [Crocinitomicaceae bacterium]
MRSYAKANIGGFMQDVSESLREYSYQKSKGITKKDLMDIIKKKNEDRS